MAKIELSTIIDAPVERCFDLARSIDLHVNSMAHTGEQAVSGKTSGLIILGETVTWRAKHLGVWQTLTSKITDFNYPHSFTDEMVEGAFKSMRHEHIFYTIDKQTVMKDVFVFESPFGIIGKVVDFLFLSKYLKNLLLKRNMIIKAAAENNN